ncbi:MAG: ABC transporter substrate-binding protein [Candidatus Limnocylindrales bacterium]
MALILAAGLAGCSASASPAASGTAPGSIALASATPAASSGGVSASSAAGSASSALAAGASAQPAGSGLSAPTFPLTLTDDEGTTVTIPAAPARIVSLAPSVTETLFALGEGARVVGVTSSDDYPPAAKTLPQVATYTGVELEKLVAARPDLVIGWKGITSAVDIARIRSLNIPLLVLYAQSVPQVLRDIALVGEATGEASAGASLDATLTSEMTAVTAAARATGTDPRTFYELDATKTIYGPAPDDFTTDMIRRAGGDPITSGIAGVYSISLERLVAADPQVIVLGDANYGTTAAMVAARPGWSGMTAVRDHAVRPIDDVIVTRPGPRIIEGLEALAEAIHPGLALPSFPPVSMGAP